MKYLCLCCGEGFDEPLISSGSQPIDADGNREPYRYELCPYCGEGHFEINEGRSI